MKTLRALCVLILCGMATLNTGQAFAQIPGQATNGAVVVATCGIAPTNYPAAGARGPHTVDVNGNECTSATVATGALATSANQTNGTQQTKVVDGSGNVLPTTASGPVVPTSADGIVVSYEALTSGRITVAMTATTSTSVIPGTASQYVYVSSCSFSNDHASTDTLMELQDGSGGTAIWIGIVPHGGGNDPIFPIPLKVPTSGNGLFVVNVTTGSSTYAACNGFKSAVSY